MKHCTNCGEEIPTDAEVCTNCGVNQSTPLEADYRDRGENQKYCVNCGELIYKQAEQCPECGATQPARQADSKSTDQVAAGLLALLLGSFGVHKFYQGNVRNGIIYLCFFWTGIPGLLGLIEGILMLISDEEEYERKWAGGAILGR